MKFFMDTSWVVRTLLTVVLALTVSALSTILFWVAPNDLKETHNGL